MLCFRKVLVAKKFLDKREWEVSRFSLECISSHSAEKCRRGILYPFINFVYHKILDERVGGSVKIFRRSIFVPQFRNFSQGNPLGCL